MWPAVTYSDDLLAVNTKNQHSHFEKPQFLQCYNFDSNDSLLRFLGKNIDLLVTRDHRMIVAKNFSEWEVAPADLFYESIKMARMLSQANIPHHPAYGVPYSTYFGQDQSSIVPLIGGIEQITAIEEVSYTGKVYCATVSTGALMVRRNGKVSICGNCIEHPQITFNCGYFPHSVVQQGPRSGCRSCAARPRSPTARSLEP